jgi:hypothetical protein
MVKRTAILVLLATVLVQAPVVGRQRVTTVTDAKYGLTFAVPTGWATEVHSSYEVISRGPEGGLETHAVVLATPDRAVRDYFLVAGEVGSVHTRGTWTCASSRSWRPSPGMEVVVCAKQLKNGHALLVSLIGRKEWLHRVDGETFLRSLTSKMRGFHADDD